MERLTPDINEIGTTEKTNTEIVFAKALQIFCLTYLQKSIRILSGGLKIIAVGFSRDRAKIT